MVQDLERQVSKRLLRALDPLAGVRLGESNTKVLSHSFGLALVRRSRNINVSSFGESVEEFDALTEIGVVDTRLESESVFYRARKGIEEVESSSKSN